MKDKDLVGRASGGVSVSASGVLMVFVLAGVGDDKSMARTILGFVGCVWGRGGGC